LSKMDGTTELVTSEPPTVAVDVAAGRVAELLEPAQIDALLADAEATGIGIDGPDGLISRMIKAVLERGLEVEMADHLGYDCGDPAGQGSGNSRNGITPKTVITSAGQARDRGAAGPQRQLRRAAGAEAETPTRLDQRHACRRRAGSSSSSHAGSD
jgi:Transposase, Mutator family